MIEIEKTFLVKNVPADLSQYKALKIKQGYIVSKGSKLRIRSKGDKFEFTKKQRIDPTNASVQQEENINLTSEEFQKLWKLVDEYLEKTRYIIPLPGGLTAEMDIFEGKLAGLMFVDVEFPDEGQLETFVAPDWFGRDISQEEFAANDFLSGKSFETIKNLL